jgi:sugar phosphate isomerase/epimerase
MLRPPEYYLAINTGFALNRFSEPEEWTRIIGDVCQVKFVQFTADLLNPSLPAPIRQGQIRRILKCCSEKNIQITSCFTGAFTRVNHLAHPEREVQLYWIQWFKDFVDQAVDLGAKSIGSHFGIFTQKDDSNPQLREVRRQQNIENWHLIALYAKEKGLQFISWEPMSISREQGETLESCDLLQKDVNQNAPLPFKIVIDVDHGDLSSPNPDDTDPYAWLLKFGSQSCQIHLKQSNGNKGGHWPFTKEYNATGRIKPSQVLDVLRKVSQEDTELILELSFRERQPMDSQAESAMKESADFWKGYVKR